MTDNSMRLRACRTSSVAAMIPGVLTFVVRNREPVRLSAEWYIYTGIIVLVINIKHFLILCYPSHSDR